MQAITIAIGKKGIEYFAQMLVANKVTEKLGKMVPPNRDINIGGFSNYTFPRLYYYEDVKIFLTNGIMHNFHPGYKNVEQTAEGLPTGNQFNLLFEATNFSVSYHWKEQYRRCYSDMYGYHCFNLGDEFDNYHPTFKSLIIDAVLSFVFEDKDGGSYELRVKSCDNDVIVDNPNMPKKTVLGYDTKCFKSQVNQATAQMIASIDFSKQIEEIFPAFFASIPASGKLTDTITYDFSVALGKGENGLQFPNNPESVSEAGKTGNGITIGVTGNVTWRDPQGKVHRYEGEEPPLLPVPRVPQNDEEQFMNAYVSNYEINALFWAYFKEGKLNQEITPTDLPDPDVLYTGTYPFECFEIYDDAAMNLNIIPSEPPVCHFQEVYIFSDSAMETLKRDLPADKYSKLEKGVKGRAFSTYESLEDKLKSYGFDTTEMQIVKRDTAQEGLVTKQNVRWELVIQDKEEGYPNIIFEMNRENILVDLKLGATGYMLTVDSFKTLEEKKVPGDIIKKLTSLTDTVFISKEVFLKAVQGCIGVNDTDKYKTQILESATYPVQSLKFGFQKVYTKKTVVNLISTTVPDFDEDSFGSIIWPIAGEPRYAETMEKLGVIGTPIPIMKDFHFLFGDESKLTIADGYISIAAKVKYKP